MYKRQDVNNKENADVRKSISDLKALGLSDAAVTVYGTIGNKPVHIDKICLLYTSRCV